MSGAAALPRQAVARPAQPESADLSAWLAVIAGAIGSLMATLDISIVNSSLPTIQGEIGASPTEGTWIATSYLVAEIVIIPLSGWLERMLGLRRFLLGAAVLFTIFSIVCGTATGLNQMILGRIGQGFTGGAMIPTAMTIIATRLPRRQQPIGTSLFGATVIMGPVLGPLAGGWLTENFSWHYAFFVNLPVCAVLVVFLFVGLEGTKAKLDEFFEADWAGIVGLALGLGGLTVVLEEGHREQWFESSLIWKLTIVTLLGFVLIGVGQFTAKRPVIRLALLRKRAFAAVFGMALVVGAVLYGTSYTIPQFLAAVAGYDSLQSGKVVLVAGFPSLLMMPLLPLLITRVDVRIMIGTGFLLMALSCWLDSRLTPFSVGHDFTDGQILRGFGQSFSMMFLNQSALAAVEPHEAGDASGLFNAARNLGGSIALAVLATVQDARLDFHHWTLNAMIAANDPAVQGEIARRAGGFGVGPAAQAAAIRAFDLDVQRQALVMAFNDDFFVLVIAILVAAPAVLLLRPLPKHAKVSMGH